MRTQPEYKVVRRSTADGFLVYAYVNADDAKQAEDRARQVFPDKFRRGDVLDVELVIPAKEI